MKLKVGDKVRIRKDLDYGIYTSSDGKCRNNVMKPMIEIRGSVATIKDIAEEGHIFIDSSSLGWIDTMFEEIIANKSPKLKPGMAVHCDTEEKSKIFLQECERQGVVSRGGKLATNLNVWNQLKENTYYGISEGKLNTNNRPFLGFCDLDYYKNHLGFDILEFDDLFKECTLDNNEKVEDVAKYRKTKYEVIYDRPDFIHMDVEKVMTNDDTTIVILGTGEEGFAKCSPDDKFNLLVGYNIAYHRARVKHFENMIVEEECKIKYLERGDF